MSVDPQVIGYIAALSLGISITPQLYYTLKHNKVKDISYLFLYLQFQTGVLCLAFTILIKQTPLIIANVMFLSQSIFLFILRVYYDKNTDTDVGKKEIITI
tara:strand:+ start:180 stop:482 length:303 start_codon:yes stop_codon:yes gene_type:complete